MRYFGRLDEAQIALDERQYFPCTSIIRPYRLISDYYMMAMIWRPRLYFGSERGECLACLYEAIGKPASWNENKHTLLPGLSDVAMAIMIWPIVT